MLRPRFTTTDGRSADHSKRCKQRGMIRESAASGEFIAASVGSSDLERCLVSPELDGKGYEAEREDPQAKSLG